MFQTIPTDTSSLYWDQVTQLEGIEYTLQFRWAVREGCWYLGIYDQDANPLALSIRLVVSFPLLRRFTDPRLPPGVLFCCDMSGADQDIVDYTDLGTRVLLTYVTSDDDSLA